MIKKALQYLLQKTLPATVNVNGRRFVMDDTYKEVTPEPVIDIITRNPDGTTLEIGTIESLIRFCKKLEKDGEFTRIVIGSTDVSTVFGCYPDLDEGEEMSLFKDQISTVSVPLRRALEDEQFKYEEFLDFLDQYTGKIAEETDLRNATRLLKVIDTKSMTAVNRGAYVSYEIKGGKDIENGNVILPKVITLTAPVGTREFEIPSQYILRLDITNMSFTLTHKSNDGSFEELVKQIREMLEKELDPEKYLILEGV